MKKKTFRNIITASALVAAIFFAAGANAFASETDNSLTEMQKTEALTTIDLITPEEIAGEHVQYLPTYRDSDLGIFSNLDDLAEALIEANKSYESNVSFTYTGNLTTIKTDMSNAINKSLTQANNDYVHGTLSSWKYQYTTSGQFTMNFTYQATPEQELFVTEQVKLIAASLLTPDMSEEDKVRAVNDYVVTNTVYSTKASTTPHHIYAYLKEGKAVCQAYALLTYRLLTEMNVEARYIVGNAGGPHAWNSVNIDGIWYHLDTTWNDVSFNGHDTVDNVGYRYYLVTSETLHKDHTWDEASYPVATNNKFSYMHNIYMGIEHNGEIYYSHATGNTLYKLNPDSGTNEQLFNHRVYCLAAHNEYIYFSDYSNGAYLTSYNIISGETKVIDASAVKHLQIVDGHLKYIVGSTTKLYELPLTEAEQAVRNVEFQITTLSEFSSQADLVAARQAYSSLTSEQQSAVANLDKLERLEEVYPINLAAANTVANMINNHSTSSSRIDLLSVINQFDTLTPSQQAHVSNKSTVLEFKAIISAQDKQINSVEKAISALKSSSKTYLSDIQKVRDSYDALAEELKTFVMNYTTLQKVETDTSAAKNATLLISKLDGSSITDMVNARAAYDIVPKALQKYVTNYKTLTGFESKVKNVLAAIKAIDAIDPSSSKFVSQVTSARKAYNKTGTLNSLVTNAAEFFIIEKQAIVFDQISKLNVNSKKYITEVTAAKDAFNALGETTSLVSNIARLNAAIEAIKPAQAVVAQINALDGASAKALEDARTAYNTLDKVSQKYVSNLKVLTTKEKELKNVLAAIKAIDAIDPGSPKFISQVYVARSAYKKTSSQQHLVTNGAEFLTIDKQAIVYDQIAKLKVTSKKYIAEVTAAKDAFDALGETTALVTNIEKLNTAIEAIKPAQAVIAKINTLDGASAKAIEDARSAYNALNKVSQQHVTNIKVLTTKEKELKNVLTAIKAIAAIDPASPNFFKQVKTARTAYNKAGSQQHLVTNSAEFLTIDKQVLVYDQIAKLNATSKKYIAEVTAAKTAYDALGEATTHVTNVEKLNAAIEAIKPAQKVIAQIDSLSSITNVDITILQDILDARNSYNALDKNSKKYISNLKVLTAAEKKIAAPLKVINSINAIKNIDVTKSTFSSKAVAMKKAYLALSTENKELITNIDDYNYYVALYEVKNAQKTRKWANVSVESFINLEITGVTDENYASIISGFNSLKAGVGTTNIAEIQMYVNNFGITQ